MRIWFNNLAVCGLFAKNLSFFLSAFPLDDSHWTKHLLIREMWTGNNTSRIIEVAIETLQSQGYLQGLDRGLWHLASSRTPGCHIAPVQYIPLPYLPVHTIHSFHTRRNIVPSPYIYYYIMRHREEWEIYTYIRAYRQISILLYIRRERARAWTGLGRRPSLVGHEYSPYREHTTNSVLIWISLDLFKHENARSNCTSMHTCVYTIICYRNKSQTARVGNLYVFRRKRFVCVFFFLKQRALQSFEIDKNKTTQVRVYAFVCAPYTRAYNVYNDLFFFFNQRLPLRKAIM